MSMYLRKILLLVLVAIALGLVDYSLAGDRVELEMNNSDQYRVVKGEGQSELQKFASWFHQDWKLIFPNFHEGARMYVNDMSSSRRMELKKQLQRFVDANSQSTVDAVKKEWLNLGAQGWQSELDIKITLQEFIELM